MIFLVAALSLGLSLWLWLRQAAAEPTLGERLAEAAFPISVCLTLVIGCFAVLSLRWVGPDLSEATIGELRALEASIPSWAEDVRDALPKWYHTAALAAVALAIAVYRSRSAPAEHAGLDRQQRVIARLRSAGNWATGISCGLCAAAALTLFGDGLADMKGDIKKELHEAQLRFDAGNDIAVRKAAAEVAQQAITALATYSPPNNQSWSSTRSALRDVRSTLQYRRPMSVVPKVPRWPDLQHSGNADPISQTFGPPKNVGPSQRAQLNALERFAEVASFEIGRDSDALASAVRERAESASAENRADGLDDLRNGLSRATLRRMSEGETAKPAGERRELSKELIAGVTDQVKDLAGKDPLMVLFAEAVTPMVTEMLATLTSHRAMEPLLNRWWAAGTKEAGSTAIADEVKARVARVDISKHWGRAAPRAGDFIAAAAALRTPASGDEGAFSGEERARLASALRSLGAQDAANRIEQLELLASREPGLEDVIDSALRSGSEAVTSRGLLNHETLAPKSDKPVLPLKLPKRPDRDIWSKRSNPDVCCGSRPRPNPTPKPSPRPRPPRGR